MKYLLHLLVAVGAASAASPPVRISLKSSWKAPPSLVELLETFSLQDSSSFFPLLDLLTNREVLSSTKLSAEGLHQATVEIAATNGLLDGRGSEEMIEMNLAMHAATPKIEAFYNWYDTRYNASEGRKCGSWVDWYGDVVCDVETLARLAGVETIDSQTKSGLYIRPKLLTFDHIHPSSELLLERPHRTAILYASLDSPNFRELHEYLYKLSNQPKPHVEYVLRHIPPANPSERSSTLSGYGVSLDLKKMDYLALDDRLAKTVGKNQHSETTDEELAVDPIAKLIEAYPENEMVSDAQLTEAEFTAIGPQAVQLIADSDDPLETWITLSQNFPKYAKSIPRRVVANQSIADELASNGQQVQPGMNLMWINGAMLDGKDAEPLGLLRQLRKERGVMQSLTSLGLSQEQAIELLTHPNISSAQRNGGGITDGLFDASDRQEGGELVVYWNDMNKDKRYTRWNPSLYALLRPMYPGQFPSIKGNLFNVILALDLSQTANLHFMVGPMSNILEKNLPFRFGVVPIAETEDGTKMARLLYHLIKVFGRKKTLAFLKQISQPRSAQTSETVYWPVVEETYNDFLAAELSENPGAEKVPFNTVLKGDEATNARLEKLTSYHDRLGSGLSQSKTGTAFFNGKPYVFDGQFLRYLQADFAAFQQYYQEAVYNGILGDKDLPEVGDHIYDLPTTSKRRSLYIFPKSPADLQLVSLPEALSKARLSFLPGSYLYSDADAYPLSAYVVGDFDSEGGLSLVQEALNSLTETSNARISFIPNPTHVNAFGPESRSALLSILARSGSLKTWSSKESIAVLKSALGITRSDSPGDDAQKPLSRPDALGKVSQGIDFSADNYAKSLLAGRVFLKQLKIEPGQLAVIVNGRVVSPIAPGTFSAGDFEALEGYELRKRTEPVAAALQEVAPKLTEDKLEFAEATAMTSSVLAKIQQPDPSESGLFDSPPKPRHRNYNILASEYTAFEFGNNKTALYHIAAIVDPLSEDGQKWSSLFKWLSNVPDVFIKIYLNPGPYTNLPLKRYYRYNLLPKLTYDVEGQEVASEVAFRDLPIDPIYTLAMDVPSSWLVRPRESLYDLDNIQLGQLLPQDDSVKAIFSLDALILDGHAREAITQAPPRGVQLQLVTPTPDGESVPIQDTLVVANLGYFQFRVGPGVFGLEIREGRGRKIYAMESVGGLGWESPTVEEAGNEVALTSFEGVTLYPRLTRQPGMEREDVLAEPADGDGGILENITSKVFGMFKKKDETGLVPVKRQADINIFTVASGLLYERFASIMILSVLRNTQHTVKFWFIENFLSPSFLEFIPHMAAEYGFDYELVTYKWPSWLRAQSEKQRIIWAYKILFLDVLFPMDLKKVIFVDADQIVRADLKELVDLDLHGAPYGYTPMGDDNTDMEGFRFWKTGYWKNFLEGRPYHISALYVIDLVKFRQMAAGDILRQQYQALSADPNSLANLDQDLPNNLQQQVPIYSLHEDWLWCETWCSKDRLHKAKTIDLCQNPLTKEPKLARARQIPEWEEYDREIAKFTRSLAEQGKISSGLSTADTNVLAGGNKGSASEEAEKSPASDESAPTQEERPRDEL